MRPEILAPAGDRAALEAALRSGADAIYLGLAGHNARARASNFDPATLGPLVDRVHAHGAKVYVTMNTLVFDHELPEVESFVRVAAEAGVDALIVQDLGLVRLARAVAPSLPVHASTQMTCTDASSVLFAAELGASRVVVARELSLDDIADIRARTDVELEVFVHGALCVAYSGQCLTSEAIGGRSANRGACAQACRLPYELVVDGRLRDLGPVAYLLSTEDLEASSLVPRLAELGVASLKIEGRLKGPDYVAAATRLYREAVDAVQDAGAGAELPASVAERRRDTQLTYSRGAGPGFLAGVDHQRMVEGRTCEHRGLPLGRVVKVSSSRGRRWFELALEQPLSRGDGVMLEGGRASVGERGGRVWHLERAGSDVERAVAGDAVRVFLGPEVSLDGVDPGTRVFKTGEPATTRRIVDELERDPYKEPIDLVIRGGFGELFELEARSERGLHASVVGDSAVEPATGRALDVSILSEKLGRLGDTPYTLRTIDSQIPDSCSIPLSALNRARRELSQALARSAQRRHPTTDVHASSWLASISFAERLRPPAGLFVLCRTLEQAQGALGAGAEGVYLDFLELVGVGKAVAALRAASARFVGVAPPRIRKPGEEKIDRYLAELEPDAVLVRSLGAMRDGKRTSGSHRPLRIGDFSLNVANRMSAQVVLEQDLDAFTPSFDLDAAQLSALLGSGLGPLAELVLHHPMPLFHTEHCVFAALLSDGRDFRTCGRPCERHRVSLRDRAGMDHPVEADVGCRNTIFHQNAQSAAASVVAARRAGVERFRIELVRETPGDVERIVQAYRRLLAGSESPAQLLRSLRTEGGYGVVRGSLRVLD